MVDRLATQGPSPLWLRRPARHDAGMSTIETSRIVVGVDGSASADRALAWAAQAAAKRGVAVDIVHAWTMPWSGRLPDLVTLEPTPYEQGAKDLLDSAVERASHLGFHVDLRPHLVNEHPTVALLDAADTAALLVVGSQGRGRRGHRVVGSVSQQCAAHARHPAVVVVPEEWDRSSSGRIVVGVDGSEPSYSALHFAASEAARWGAELDVVHAHSEPDQRALHTGGWLPTEAAAHRDDLEKASQRLLEDMTGPFRAGSGIGPTPASVELISVEGDAARTLLATAKGADLLVVGSRGLGGFAGLLLGSVSQRCLHHATCPVAVVHS